MVLTVYLFIPFPDSHVSITSCVLKWLRQTRELLLKGIPKTFSHSDRKTIFNGTLKELIFAYLSCEGQLGIQHDITTRQTIK